MRISSILDDLVYSKQNITTVKENVIQEYDVFKVLMKTHQQHNELLPDEEKNADNQWFDDIDETACSFKHQTYNRIRENEDDQKSN